MEKWLLSILLLSGLSLTTEACNPRSIPADAGEPAPEPNPDPTPPDPDDPQPGKGRSLVVYFSYTNTTQGIAAQIADITGSPTHRIESEGNRYQEAVGFKGRLYSPEHRKWQTTDYSEARIIQDPQEKRR